MTIKDIARLSGYGLGTVSRVLNNHPDVSKKARERILAVVHEQGFEPNANAKYLKTQAQSSVAVLVKGSQNFLFGCLLHGAVWCAVDAGDAGGPAASRGSFSKQR